MSLIFYWQFLVNGILRVSRAFANNFRSLKKSMSFQHFLTIFDAYTTGCLSTFHCNFFYSKTWCLSSFFEQLLIIRKFDIIWAFAEDLWSSGKSMSFELLLKIFNFPIFIRKLDVFRPFAIDFNDKNTRCF